MKELHFIRLKLSSVAPLLIPKIQQYSDLLKKMDSNDGWFPFPDSVLDYFDELNVVHWAELYFYEGRIKWLENRKDSVIKSNEFFVDQIGENPSREFAENFLNKFAEGIADLEEPISGLEFLENAPDASLARNLSDSERLQQRDILIQFMVGFYNDLSYAAHGESIFSLVNKAKIHKDLKALTKAIQIDSTLIKYFEKVLFNNQLRGNADFFDSLSYRIKNSPRKGSNRHPLLWILFKDLASMNCLHASIKNAEILNVYQTAVENHPNLSIVDVQVVERQRRKFNQMYRLVK